MGKYVASPFNKCSKDDHSFQGRVQAVMSTSYVTKGLKLSGLVTVAYGSQ